MSYQTARNDPYQIVTDLILGHLERGVVPWRCPWKREVGRPKNFSSRREYRGINSLLLGMTGYASPWWMTFRQAQEAGGSIRKGEKSSLIMKYGKNEKATKDGGGEEDKRVTYYLRSYHVFNSTQIEGIEFPAMEAFAEEIPSQEKLRRAESIVAQMPMPPAIKAGKTVKACYKVRPDTVNIPAIGRFDQPEDYYQTLFHELIHATDRGRKSAFSTSAGQPDGGRLSTCIGNPPPRRNDAERISLDWTEDGPPSCRWRRGGLLESGGAVRC